MRPRVVKRGIDDFATVLDGDYFIFLIYNSLTFIILLSFFAFLF